MGKGGFQRCNFAEKVPVKIKPLAVKYVLLDLIQEKAKDKALKAAFLHWSCVTGQQAAPYPVLHSSSTFS